MSDENERVERESAALRVAASSQELAVIKSRLEAEIEKRKHAERLLRERETQSQDAQNSDAAVNQAKLDFLAHMSHEVRTPLNSVLGMADLLLATNLDERQRRFATMLTRSGNSLLTIIGDLLDFSRIEAGQLELHEQMFNTQDLIEDVADSFSEQAKSKQLALRCCLPADLDPWIYGDVARLRLILENLVGNAVKFTEHGEVVLQVAAQPGVAAGDPEQLRIVLSDTGTGLSAEVKERFFSTLNQAHRPATPGVSGSGSRLMMSKRIVELMGGEIRVSSEPNRGSQFSLTLPWEVHRRTAEVPENRALAEPEQVRVGLRSPRSETAPGREFSESNDSATDGSLAGRTILVVEDDPVNQEVVHGMLLEFGCEVDLVDGGYAALDCLQTNNFDLILMDCMMPDLDGYQTTGKIRESEQSFDAKQRLPIVALTANAMGGDLERCLAAGMDDYLAKPFKREDLFKILRLWLE